MRLDFRLPQMVLYTLWGQDLELTVSDEGVSSPVQEYNRKEGADEFLNPLFRHYRSSLVGFACSRGLDAASAEDAVHDAYILGRRKFHQLRDPEKVSAWVKAIIINLAKNVHRQKRLKVFRDAPDVASGNVPSWIEHLEPVDSTAETDVLSAETMDLLHTAIPELDDLSRQVIQDHYFDGLSIEQIMNLRDLPEGTVKRRLFTARFRLRRALERRGFTAEDLL